ncbi:MAG: flagellar hook capping FlgD N-terminal domain-containing protein [Mycobacterium sp.]|nr:flagellar hook capping FlgD N-terminal domain-containing protein [Mycobacterium sp.]
MSIAAASTAASTNASSTQNALDSLSGNFQDFLGMLMTQLKNQDPTSPLDTNQFTSELVEFSGVEQQINTNNAMTQLNSLTQSGQLLQSSAMIGKTVEVSAKQMPLQSSSGSLTFTDPTAGTAEITITNAAGTKVLDTTVNATAGSNTWTWNGQDSNGKTQPDGAYNVAVTDTNAAGTTSSLAFTVSGTVTGVVENSGTLDVQMGAQTAAFSAVQSVSS